MHTMSIREQFHMHTLTQPGQSVRSAFRHHPAFPHVGCGYDASMAGFGLGRTMMTHLVDGSVVRLAVSPSRAAVSISRSTWHRRAACVRVDGVARMAARCSIALSRPLPEPTQGPQSRMALREK